MMEKFIGKKEKWTNKENDQQWVAVSSIHSTTNHYQVLCHIQNSEESTATGTATTLTTAKEATLTTTTAAIQTGEASAIYTTATAATVTI